MLRPGHASPGGEPSGAGRAEQRAAAIQHNRKSTWEGSRQNSALALVACYRQVWCGRVPRKFHTHVLMRWEKEGPGESGQTGCVPTCIQRRGYFRVLSPHPPPSPDALDHNIDRLLFFARRPWEGGVEKFRAGVGGCLKIERRVRPKNQPQLPSRRRRRAVPYHALQSFSSLFATPTHAPTSPSPNVDSPCDAIYQF